MNRGLAVLAIAVVVGLLVAAFFLLGHGEAGLRNNGNQSSPGLASNVFAPAPAAPVAQGLGASASSRRSLTTEQRVALKRSLDAARLRRRQRSSTASAVSSGQEQPATVLNLANKTGVDNQWERRQLAVLNQLLGECIDIATADAALEGRLVLRFSIVAEPEVGGLVEDVSFVDDDTTVKDANLRECVHESIYALELDPPPDGVQVDREVTLRLESDPEEAQ